MSFNINMPLGRSNSMSGLSGLRITSKDPSSVDAVFYDLNDRVIQATYTLVDGTQETVDILYTEDNWLKYQDITYRNYDFDLFSASIVPKDSEQSTLATLERQAREDQVIASLDCITKELKLLNLYMSEVVDEELEI